MKLKQIQLSIKLIYNSSLRKTLRFDKNEDRGSLFVYVPEGIPRKKLKICDIPEDAENISIEVNVIKTKWLFMHLSILTNTF